MVDAATSQAPVYYLCGPMSGYPAFNVPAFNEAASVLRTRGYTVRVPHEIVPATDGLTWRDYLREDIAALLGCQALVLLPGWPRSKGARLELATALGVDLPVFYYDEGRLVDMNAEPPSP